MVIRLDAETRVLMNTSVVVCGLAHMQATQYRGLRRSNIRVMRVAARLGFAICEQKFDCLITLVSIVAG